MISERSTRYLTFAAVFCIAMGFALYTGHVWEDYYITFRASKNLAMGHGLVFTEGQKVHTFTSPLGVLIPAALSAASGNRSDAFVLWAFRFLSSGALAFTAVLLLGIARAGSYGFIPGIALIGMFALDVKTIDFSVNGMETALMMLFLALTLRALIVPIKFASLQLGIAWAGLMWTRPDSFIYIGALAFGFLAFNPACETGRSRKNLLEIYLKAGLIASLIYLPWVLWAWSYYGSPIPHTVIAKGFGKQLDFLKLMGALVLYPIGTLLMQRVFDVVLLPAYALMGGWPHWVAIYSKILIWICAFYWCIPRGAKSVRALSLALMLSTFYIDQIVPFPFPWYLPSCALLAAIVFSGILQRLSVSSASSKALLRNSAGILAGFILITSFLLTLCAAYQLRTQQREIETGNRKEIGLWLSRNAATNKDTVFLEPLGYIGYFSQLKMLDYPGLASPEVVAVRKKLGKEDVARIIAELKPDWLVLRPSEIASIAGKSEDIIVRMYSKAKVFNVSDRVKSYRWLPGREYLERDQTYTVYKRIMPVKNIQDLNQTGEGEIGKFER